MELFFDCVPCMIRQALEAARTTTNDVEIHDKVVYETINLMTKYKEYRNSPDLAREIHRIVKEQTELDDPYSKIKERDLEAAIGVYPYLKEFLQKNRTRELTRTRLLQSELLSRAEFLPEMFTMYYFLT